MAVRMSEKGNKPTERMGALLQERERLDRVIQDCFSREITIMFSDICGFTRYTDEKGDLQSRAMLLRHNKIVLPAIECHEGSVIEVIGDGVMAAFNDPLDAVQAAVGIQTQLQAANTGVAPGEAIHVKIGINAGKVLLDEDADFQSLTGDVANVAARIQNHAGRDEILLSQFVYDLIKDRCEWDCRFHNDVMFKGKAQSIAIYRVIWRDPDCEAPAIRPAAEALPPLLPSAAMDPDGTTLALEINLEGHDLKISINEGRAGEADTIRHYETIAYAADRIAQRCKVLVRILNKANRRGRVAEQTLGQLREIGQVLYDDLLSLSVKEKLHKSKAKTLVLSIDDRLVHIPWELLYDGQQFFCLKFSMGRVVKTRQTPASVDGRPLTAPIEMLVLADPTGDLKNAYAEGTQIRDFLDQRADLINATLRTDYVSADTLKAKFRTYDLVHFAGHADYSPQNPETGGWRLLDSRLTTEDITQMAGSAAMPKLVFANACQSARTDQWALDEAFESGIFGMANAFLLAGVKHYIGTFWEILDEPGSHFAIEFYKHLFSGVSIGQAVLNARRALVELYGEETIIWASYVFYGDPAFNYMDQVRAISAENSPQKRGGYLKPAFQDRTREEVIDFKNGRKRKSWTRRWAAAAVVLLLVILGVWGIPMYRSRGFAAQEHKALALFMAGDYDTAEPICRRLRNDAPARPVSAMILGNIQLARGKLDDARRFFSSALESSPGKAETRVEALIGLGRLASIDSRTDEAMKYYRQAAGLDPTSVRALSSQAVLLERQGNLTEALQVYNLASSLAPGDAGLQVAAGQIQDRLATMQDQARQARIDRLVKDILAAGHAAPVLPGNGWTSPPLTVWLLEFETSGFSTREGAERMIHGLIADRLVNNERVQMVERALLDKLLSELKLGSSRLADSNTALAIGRLAAARIILSGRLIFLQGHLQVVVRIVECETGVVRASLIEDFDPSATPVTVAERLSSRILSELRKKYPIRATITALREGNAVLDAGQEQGIRQGMLFNGDGDVVVRIHSVDIKASEAEIIAGKPSIRNGMRIEEHFEPEQ